MMPCLPAAFHGEHPVPPRLEAPCTVCALGRHPDRDHDGCGCPCSFTAQQRFGSIFVTVRAHPVGWAACHGGGR